LDSVSIIQIYEEEEWVAHLNHHHHPQKNLQ
jgi:hypothetical protein